MPLDFIASVEGGLRHLDSDAWLTPASVHGLDDADFVTLPPAHREELFRSADEFRAVAEAVPNVTAGQREAARAALVRLGELLRPYRTKESRAVLEVLWDAWKSEGAQEWAATFDYRLDEDWTGDPAVYVWLIFADGVNRLDPTVRADRNRLEMLIHMRLQDAGIDRYPYFRARHRSEVSRPVGATA